MQLRSGGPCVHIRSVSTLAIVRSGSATAEKRVDVDDEIVVVPHPVGLRYTAGSTHVGPFIVRKEVVDKHDKVVVVEHAVGARYAPDRAQIGGAPHGRRL